MQSAPLFSVGAAALITTFSLSSHHNGGARCPAEGRRDAFGQFGASIVSFIPKKIKSHPLSSSSSIY